MKRFNFDTTIKNPSLIFFLSVASLYIIRWSLLSKISLFILCTILFFFVSLIMLTMLMILVLDRFYRPNIPQYPFNIILDTVIPIGFLIIPSLSILSLNPFNNWFTCFGLVILIHSVIIIPVLHYWSNLRRWNSVENIIQYKKWNHPRLYKHIAIASLYPLIWGLYFSFSRYLRLGSIIDISHKVGDVYIDFIIIFTFLIPWLFLLTYSFLKGVIKIRLYIWNELYVLLYSCHVSALRYYLYFKFMELLYKFIFVIRSLLSLHGYVYYVNPDKPKLFPLWRRVINYLFTHTYWFTIIFFLSLLIEILLTGKLFYGIYTLFLFPLLRGILYCFFAFGRTDFIFDCCFCDYVQQNLINPRYPTPFWTYFDDAEYYFGFAYEFTQKDINIITTQLHKYKWKLRKQVSRGVHYDQLDTRINNFRYSFRKRLFVAYLQSQHVRFMHTEVVSRFHSATALFAKSTYDKIVLVNNSWRNMQHIQKAGGIPDRTPPNMYLSYKQTFPFKKTHFIGVQEENLPSNFTHIINEQVRVEPYKPYHQPVYLPQPNPDIIFDFRPGTFNDKRIHALDQKTNDPGLGKSKILSDITNQRFETTLLRFTNVARDLGILNTSMQHALKELRSCSFDPSKYQLAWAKNLHLFPSNCIPPLRIPKNFNTSQFTKEALLEIKKSEIRMKRVSDYLYFKKVPQTTHGNFPQEALDILNDSQMQWILENDSFP